jgi:tRNA A-37 threonylcarbamoyl transferase component Bud32
VADWIDRACDGYEAEWKSGRHPRIEVYLADAPEHERPALFRELLLLEIEFRDAGGERPTVEEYRARFPQHETLIGSVFGLTDHARDAPARPWPLRGAITRTRFRILRLHDQGGLGDIYLARDQELNRDVALKEIQNRFADHPLYRARFQFEAEITGALEHPGIVPVYGLGHHADGRPYYAMRFIKGDSLKEAIAKYHGGAGNGPEPGERGLALRGLLRRFLDVCNAVAYAHSRGVLHRDLKPGNIIVGQYGETLVVDWGLAKVVGRSDASAP